MTDASPDASGLATGEARERLARFGPNEITATEASGWLQALRSVATEPMFVLLVAAAAVYLLLGDLGEGLLLSAFAGISVGLVVVQDRRSARALDALRALSVPQVRVVRDGRLQRIPSRELVPGDLLAVAEGDRLPADAVLREAAQLRVDESLLTGESVPVDKRADARDVASVVVEEPGGDDLPWVFAGTLVVAGHGLAEVTGTGAHTRAGAIGSSLAAITQAPTPLQLHLRRLVGWLGAGAIALSGLMVVWYGWTRGDWVEGLLLGIASAMSMLPEEFPMALSVFLALGAWRLARVQVLARRPAVIEALGGATVLCVDKTGTLTENRMRLRRLLTADLDVDPTRGEPLPEGVHELLEHAMLASRREGTEPMDRAILRSGDGALAFTEHLHPAWALEQEYPLQAGLLAVSQSWIDEAGVRRVAAKGAPEAVVSLCHLDALQAAGIAAQVEQLAVDGLRVLGVARARSTHESPPANPHDYDFEWLGLAAFEDPLRPGVAQAVRHAREAGIAVAMITGDHAQTAVAIAREAGLDVHAGALTGSDIAAMDDAALREAARSVRVFARMQPEQKLRLVQALAANGEVVAMTGDGVNDAPALKAAHIGIAMGARGTDVAREAAAVVLLDEDFGRIVAGVEMGRRIYENLRKVMTYITAVHVPIAGVAVLPVLAGWPPLLLPAHVVLMQMMIDPVCSLAFEAAPAPAGLMRRPPRPPGEALVGWPMLWRGVVQGGCVLVAVLAVNVSALQAGAAAGAARSESIIALVVGNLGLVWLNASRGEGWRAVFGRAYVAFWVVAAFAAAVITAGLAFAGPRELLQFAPIGGGEVLRAIAVGAAGVLAAALLVAAADRLIARAER